MGEGVPIDDGQQLESESMEDVMAGLVGGLPADPNLEGIADLGQLQSFGEAAGFKGDVNAGEDVPA